MKKLTVIVIVGMFWGCSSPLDKSIFEPLTVADLRNSIIKDSLFAETYKFVQFVRDSVLKSEIDKVKWFDLTYSRLHDFVKFSNDTAYFNPVNQKLKMEWREKYGKYQAKVDSISDHWKKYTKDNSLDQYARVELVDIDKEYYSYSGDIKNVNLGFKLTPLKGQVEQIRFGYRIDAKLNEKEGKLTYSILDMSWCMSTTPFSKPTIRYWEANYRNRGLLESRSVATLLRDYNIYIEVDKIRKGGRNLTNDDLNIPKSIVNHWRYENEAYLNDLYVNDVVKELLDEEYMRQDEYVSKEIDKILRQRDQLSYEFLRLSAKTTRY